MKSFYPPRKCPDCKSDLEYIKATRKHRCVQCTKASADKDVIWSIEFLDGFEYATNKEAPS